jgi:hypothetical protein
MSEQNQDVDIKAQPLPPGGSFNLILPKEFLQKLLADEAIYANVGPFRFFFQLDDGQKPIVHTIEEFRKERGEVHEWIWTRVEPMPEPKDSENG